MLTPINSILEEFVNDVGLALGAAWQYRYVAELADPNQGLEIELSAHWIKITCGESPATLYDNTSISQPVDWETLKAGLVFFYRLVGQHILPAYVQNEACGLTKFAVGMTRAVVQGMQDDRVLTLSFKDGRSDVQFK